MPDENKGWFRGIAKAIVIMLVVILGIAIVGFGLIVGFCALGK